MPVTKFIAIYARASLDRSELRISTDRQRARCEHRAGELFPDVPIRTFEDNNRSASDPDLVRPGYEDLLSAIRRGEVAELVVHEQSRLTRQPRQWDELVVTLTRAGITKIHTVQQGTISVEAGNRLVGGILNLVDAEESERIKARSLAMAHQLALEGRPPGGRLYGYRRHRGPDGTGRPELEIKPDEAAVVRRIVDELMAGRSANAVAAGLQADGVPVPRQGTWWRGQSVMTIARRPAIAGLRTHHGKVVGPGRWEPIISLERFDALAAALGSTVVTDGTGKRRPTNRKHASKARKWLLSGGLAVCGRCGAKLTVATQPRPDGYIHAYVCSKRSGHPHACGKVSLAPAEVVEALVVEQALERLSDPTMAARLTAGDDPERAALLEELAGADARILRAAELFGAGEIDEDEWNEMKAPAKARADAARAALADLPHVDVSLPPLDLVASDWDGLTLRQQQAVLRLVLTGVKVLPRTGRRPTDPRVRVAERLDLRWRA